MSIPDILATRLLETIKGNDLTGAFLMLGRQNWIGRRRGASAALFDEALQTYLPGVGPDELKHPDNDYAERFFEHMGFDSVDSLDFSEFEGASIIQDLGGELDPSLHGRFDVIYDGGTCEHVFDLPTAYRNINKMLKPGGVLIGHSPANNWLNHAFYQICPEMVFGFWGQAMQYDVLECSLQPLRPYAARNVVTMSDPRVTGRRPRFRGELTAGLPVLLNYAVRKPLSQDVEGVVVKQSDYAKRWDDADEAD